ncbi:hypothetical protein EHQ53_09850 [Leptospira langatensis]|uniref:Uncharacterized protein n=1 Tax=Leptospira langatensis TaxID=2484983 RepID=A0A5F1ZSS8_9LEPT|nr:hypothetical protein [Leptospira langatensis]TGK00261.1 hypothetical protein EHO57_13340 [Leptospira langatensis]TGL41104.1 hypothetical protein EHQ53_09850 [Leptospira langatensis]
MLSESKNKQKRRRGLGLSILALSVFLGAILLASGHTHSSKEYSEKGIFSKHISQISGSCFVCAHAHLSSDLNPAPIRESSPEPGQTEVIIFSFYYIEDPKLSIHSQRGPPSLS